MSAPSTAATSCNLRFGIVAARWNHLITVRLVEGCVAELLRTGVPLDAIQLAWVPGAFEIPQAARALAASGRLDAVAAFGAVIRGGTPHFEYVCRAVTDGVAAAIRDTDVPIAFGVLTTEDAGQALARTGEDDGDKGAEAARAALDMAGLLPALRRGEVTA